MYKLTTNKMVILTTETGTMFIPMDENNIDYQTYLEWLAEGNTPEEAE